MTSEDQVGSEFPQRIGMVARRELALHGVGPKAVRILTEELAARGLAFRAAP